MFSNGGDCSVAGLAFNVVADPIVGYFYKWYIEQPQELAQALAKNECCSDYSMQLFL